MVLFTLVEFALETGIWTIKSTYSVGYWLLYGTPKTETEKLLEVQNEELKNLHEDLVVITKRLEQLESEAHADVYFEREKEGKSFTVDEEHIEIKQTVQEIITKIDNLSSDPKQNIRKESENEHTDHDVL